MAESPPPAVLRALAQATADHRLDRKLLLCRTIGEGRELLRALAVRRASWIGWEITTPRRLALELSAPRLADLGRGLADDFDQEAGVDIALSAALIDAPDSRLARLAETPGFRQAVAGTVRELDLAGVDPARVRAAPPPSPVRVLVAEVLAGYRDWLDANRLVGVPDVLAMAARRLEAEGIDALPTPVAYLVPGLPTAGASGRLVRALLNAGARILQADPTGLEPPAGRLWEEAPEAAPLTGLLTDGPGGLRSADLDLFVASGPADEVREVLRRVAAMQLSWDQVEIVAADPVVYGGALHALAQRLDVPVSFAVGLPAERTRTGRATAAWFRWIEEGYPAVEIRRLLESGDIRPPGWEGSTTGLARRLRQLRIGWGHGRYLPALDRALQSASGEPRPRRQETVADARDRMRREREELEALRSLLAPLLEATPLLDLLDPAARVAPGDIARGLHRFLGMVAAADAPAATARDRFITLADRIGARLTRPMPPAAALASLRRHLRIRVPAPDREGAAPWISSGGHLHLSDVEHGGLTGRPVTFVVGLDADRFPGAGLQDPLLPDAPRRALDPEALPGSAERLAADRFSMAAMLARLRGRITLSYSGWDPVEAREIAASPLMLQAFRAARGAPAASFEDMARDLGDAASAVPRTEPLDTADLWLGALSRGGILLDGTAAVREVYPALAAGADLLAGLTGDRPTPRHGLVTARGALDPRRSPDAVLSASGLEDLGTCGLRYLFRYGLRVRPPDDPELDPDRWLDPLRRGSLLHAVYERSLREARERGIPPREDAFEAHALTVLASEAEAFRREVPPPGEAVMERELVQLREDVRSFADMVRASDAPWEALELKFGLGDAPPATLQLPGGAVRVRGAIDRVDRRGDKLVVIDYKTGSTTRYERGKGLFNGGRRLQNVVYTAVAEALMDGTVERMEYHFPTRGGRNEVIGFTRAESRRGIRLIARLLDMAAAGRFLPTPESMDCTFCDYQAVCRHSTEGFSRTTPLADWAAQRFGALDEYGDLRDVRAWEELLLAGLDADG